MSDKVILIENACENNLKSVSLSLPHYRLIAVTGISGSGKSSLVQDVISREGQRLFYEYFLNRFQSGKKPAAPKASRIEGLFPVITVDQNHVVRNPRSTVGTLTEIHDFLRLLFARLGKSDLTNDTANRSLFSYNHPDGQCPVCKGLGVQDRIDPDKIVGDPEKSLREGALVLTTPNHYIIYSQVTMDVLDEVCRAEGFNVDIPWKELTEEQKNIIWSGTEKIKILFGKHPLESRLKWSGITAKPREEGFYKGILPVMEEILKRDRNPNILRFARSFTCTECHGKRLNQTARSFKLWNKNIDEFSSLSLFKLLHFFSELNFSNAEAIATKPVVDALLKRARVLNELGLGHLTLSRESTTLSGGEASRIRLANQVATGLRNVLYILDEPSAGLHVSEQDKLLGILKELVDNGNTVIAVEHDEATIRTADWICDIGPGPGKEGGEVLYNGTTNNFLSNPPAVSITGKYLQKEKQTPSQINSPSCFFEIKNAVKNNLKNITAHFGLAAFNVISGVSGSGKSSLANSVIEFISENKSNDDIPFKRVIHVDQSPIGRTPNSNPATYTGLSDHIRDLMASLDESKKRNFKKGQFSFVVKGGRCEACGGAGVQETGMHFLGNIEVICEVCNGKRFTDETLSIHFKEKNIFDILELTVDEAHSFFEGQKKITSITGLLISLGLGYLKIGQPSTTLSGGEAQRIKLAYELSKNTSGHTLYILDEPTTGLHMADIEILLKALRQLTSKGHTLICIEHDAEFILQSDWVIDLGPGSGDAGGTVIAECTPFDLIKKKNSITGIALQNYIAGNFSNFSPSKNHEIIQQTKPIELNGVSTNNLKSIDSTFPINQVSVVCGVSGSGKSSLVYDTLFSESQRRFMDGMSSYIRQFIGKAGNAVLESSHGLTPAIALRKKKASHNPRSTLGTYTGIYDMYRLLFSRVASNSLGGKAGYSSMFSFNHDEGACPCCKGIGTITVCDPEKIITNPEKSLIAGALDGTKTGRFYGDPFGQYVAALLTVADKFSFDYSKPWNELSQNEKDIAMLGCGEEEFQVEWKYKRGNHEGVHSMKTQWPGFCGHVEIEYERKHTDHRGTSMLPLMKQITCTCCKGSRLKPEILNWKISDTDIYQLSCMEAEEAKDWFNSLLTEEFKNEMDLEVAKSIASEILPRLDALIRTGLGYLSSDRMISTLSGGEFQRLALAGISMSSLSGITCVLDEPSFGLHPADTQRMTNIISTLFKNGNTVVMVDHSNEMISSSHHAIEMGPGAGKDGGTVISEGNISDIKERLNTIRNSVKPLHCNIKSGIQIKNAFANNLKNISVEIPFGCFALITGASGSGKTTLLSNVIYASLINKKPIGCEEFNVLSSIGNNIYVEQEVSLGSSQSIPIIYSGIFDSVRKAFAAAANSRSITHSHFSFHSKEGQCPACNGSGTHTVSLDFWSDAEIICEVCNGKRYRDEVLKVTIDGLNIAEILSLTIQEFSHWYEKNLPAADMKKFKHLLNYLNRVGLEYLSVGQSMNTLSTGEMQRLKLATALSGKMEGNALILLDEPTGGLHPTDTIKIISLLEDLLIEGHSIICVSHDPMLMKAAGWQLALGPGGGRFGGNII